MERKKVVFPSCPNTSLLCFFLIFLNPHLFFLNLLASFDFLFHLQCLSERYKKLYSDFKFQLVLRECKVQRERQSAELRRWEREMSKLCSDPAPLCVVNDVDLSLPPTDFIYVNEYVVSICVINL